MTEDGLALLKRITADPDDDLPRLVFADYMDDLGVPAAAAFAEFIRLQIDRARRDDENPSVRERELLAANEAAWLQVVPEGFRAGAVFRRGFPYRVECNARVLFDPNLPVLVAPIEEMRVVVTRLDFDMDEVQPQPLTLPLRALEIECEDPVGYGLLDRLHRFGPYTQLRRLRIDDYRFGDAGARLLAADTSFPNVTHLDLSYCNIGDAGAEALAESPWAGRLTELRLVGNEGITPDRREWLRYRFGAALVE